MAHCEVDSFVAKFKHLWYAGIKATLKIEAVDGEASVVLTAGLGPHLPLPHGLGPHGYGQHVRQRGPAYRRRQERRKAAREDAGNVHSPTAEVSGSISAAKAVDMPVDVAGKAETSDVIEEEVNIAEQP